MGGGRHGTERVEGDEGGYVKSHYWIKLYHEILDDAKMGRLPDRLWRRSIELFLMAGEEHDGGALPPFPDIAWRLRMDDEELLKDLEALADLGILTQLEDETWFVTNFATRQSPMDNAERQKRYRDRQRSDQYHGNGTDTLQSRNRNETVTKCNVDVDVDRDTDEDTDVDVDNHRNAFETWERALGSLSPLIADQIDDLVQEFDEHSSSLPAPSEGAQHTGDEWVSAAIREAASSTPRFGVKYVAAILDRWKREGYCASGNGAKADGDYADFDFGDE